MYMTLPDFLLVLVRYARMNANFVLIVLEFYPLFALHIHMEPGALNGGKRDDNLNAKHINVATSFKMTKLF